MLVFCIFIHVSVDFCYCNMKKLVLRIAIYALMKVVDIELKVGSIKHIAIEPKVT